jgi:phospholipase/carboxylesterase
MPESPCILPASGNAPKKLVILLHGYGSCGENLLGIARFWKDALPETEFLAPDGFEKWHNQPGAFQWFELTTITPVSIRANLDRVGPLMKAYVDKMLDKRGLGLSDLAIVGFSQGGMLALEMIFAASGIGGIICYSGGFYPPLPVKACKEKTRALLVHGDMDQVVSYEIFNAARVALEKRGLVPETLTCSGLGHSINQEGINRGQKFLCSIFAEN